MKTRQEQQLAVLESLFGPPVPIGEALQGRRQAVAEGLPADCEEVTAEEAGGLPLETRGGEPLMVPVAEGERTFSAARDRLLEGTTVLRETHKAKSHGRGEVRRTVERRNEEGLVETLEVNEKLDKEGKVRDLVIQSKGIERDRTATFGAIVAACSHGPYYTGAVRGRKTLERQIRALQQENGRLRVVEAWFDEDQGRIHNAGSSVSAWLYDTKRKGCRYDNELRSWCRARDYGELVDGFETPAALPEVS